MVKSQKELSHRRRKRLNTQYMTLPMDNDLSNYIVNQVTSNVYKYNLDRDLETPDQYRDLIELLDTATENDTVVININVWGGCIYTMIAIINAIQASQAYVVTEIVHASSAGSFIALAGDDSVAMPYSHFFAHEVQSGSYGDTSFQKNSLEFLHKHQNQMFELYKGFLSDEEINDLHLGKIREYNFLDEEINQRLDKWRAYKEEAFKKSQAEGCGCGKCGGEPLEDVTEEVKPKVKPKKVKEEKVKEV